MAAFEDMRLLKQEEKMIREMISMMNDQLNRLKVEELALVAKLREVSINQTSIAGNEATNNTEEVEESVVNENDVNFKPLMLEVNQSQFRFGDKMAEEEEEEEDDNGDKDPNDNLQNNTDLAELEFQKYQDQLTFFMKDSGHS